MNTSLLIGLVLLMAYAPIWAQEEGQEKPLTARESYYIMDHARQPQDIRADYPHDIKLRTIGGDTLISTDVLPSGKPTILLFWLTTCYPCRMELDALQKVYASWKDSLDFELVAISTDFAKNYDAVTQRVNEKTWPWPAYIDLHREFGKILPGGLNGLPQTFFLNAKGEIVGHKRKYRPGDETEIFRLLKKAAEGNPVGDTEPK